MILVLVLSAATSGGAAARGRARQPGAGLLFTLGRASHPALGERIDFANEYHPWRGGQPPVYGDRFRK